MLKPVIKAAAGGLDGLVSDVKFIYIQCGFISFCTEGLLFNVSPIKLEANS